MTALIENLSHDLAAAGDRLAGLQARRARRARLTAVIAAGALAVGGVAVAATSIWNPQLGDDRFGHATASSSRPPADQLEMLGVLRRAPTDADRGAQSQYALTFFGPDVHGVRTDSVRLLGTYGKGLGYVLVPVVDAHGKRDALCFFAQDAKDGGGQSCWTTADVRKGHAVLGMGGPMAPLSAAAMKRLRAANGGDGHALRIPLVHMGPITWSGIVPDGVARVRIDEGGQSVTADVHDNFFTATGHGLPITKPAPAGRLSFRWLDAGGKEIGPPAAG